uniref:(California timema) hypothetical protein n=1 Tax=Timema californicum TaxID=61474 RepID=A0A7R9PC30_TIMCA|nr:unnamed protein product [Timema californicum]
MFRLDPPNGRLQVTSKNSSLHPARLTTDPGASPRPGHVPLSRRTTSPATAFIPNIGKPYLLYLAQDSNSHLSINNESDKTRLTHLSACPLAWARYDTDLVKKQQKQQVSVGTRIERQAQALLVWFKGDVEVGVRNLASCTKELVVSNSPSDILAKTQVGSTMSCSCWSRKERRLCLINISDRWSVIAGVVRVMTSPGRREAVCVCVCVFTATNTGRYRAATWRVEGEAAQMELSVAGHRRRYELGTITRHASLAE